MHRAGGVAKTLRPDPSSFTCKSCMYITCMQVQDLTLLVDRAVYRITGLPYITCFEMIL